MPAHGVTIHLVAAMAQNRAIGLANKIPWHIREDLQHFKRLTTGKAIVMGRKTLESIGRALPQRKMFAVTRQKDYVCGFGIVTPSLDEALRQVKTYCASANIPPEAYIIGGEQIYREALDTGIVDFMHLTLIEKTFEGDAFFPKYDETQWKTLTEELREEEGLCYRFVTLYRR